MTFSNPENPRALQTSQLIEVHKLPYNSHRRKSFTDVELEKPIHFESLSPDFKINVNVYCLMTEELYCENTAANSFKERKTGFRRVLSGLGHGVVKVGSRVGNGLKDKWNQSISKSGSMIGLSRAGSFRFNKTSISHDTLICTSGKSRFDCCGSFRITKESIDERDSIDNNLRDIEHLPRISLSCKPTENLPKNYITKSLKVKSVFYNRENMYSKHTDLKDYCNIFLPAIPPAWEFSYLKLVDRKIKIFDNSNQDKPNKIINVADYEQVRVAEKSECFQKFVIRLIRDRDDLSSKTLLKFECEDMMVRWLERLRLIVEDRNAWM